ncbi:EAL domain-containing protein [Bacillus sp. JJ1773]|uniref:EAL domain-containing protein n=1 Tax=Bacillus sp. JJ1773 TaxID=3122965 RepID=UPI003000BDAA
MESTNKTLNLSTNHLEISDIFFRSIFEHNPDTVFFLDTKGIIVMPNEGFSEYLGYKNDEIILHSIEQFLYINEIPIYKKCFNKVLSGEVQHIDTVFIHKAGRKVQINLTLIPAKFNGKVVGVSGIAKDITEEKETAIELIESELKFRSLVEEALVGVYIIQNGKLIYGNPRLHHLLGTAISSNALDVMEYIHSEDQAEMNSVFNQLIDGKKGIDHTFRIISKDGSIIDIEAHSKRIYYHDQSTIIGTLHDVTDRKKSEELNKFLAYHDSLTELPNRRFFQEKLEKELIISKALQQKMAVMFLDLDRFKYINDTLGHFVGDELLKLISKRLKICLGEKNILARLGGDEFSVLLPNIQNTDQIIKHSETIIKSLEEPFFIEGYKLFITTSIGISIYPTDGEDAESLMKYAHSALYKSKESGKNTYQIYTSSMNIQTFKTFNLEAGLRNAIELNQLEFYYQPKVCTLTNQIVGVEALIRWNHPEWGLLSPDEFIPLAEETGLIAEIGKWVKYKACSQNKAWQDAGLPAIPISINLSASRFLEKNLVENIASILEETKLSPDYLQIEITESSLLENEKVVLATLDELRSIGVRIALDDFGTGYSSLSYLKRFRGRIDTLKIDQSFIKDLSETDPDNSNFITKTIIELAQHLKMEVVAEGVENIEQLQILNNFKCETIQGYLFSKPVPAEEFTHLLRIGKFEVSESVSGGTTDKFEDKREYFRINLDFPLLASMTLIRIHGRKVELGNTNVLIEDIGLGGLRFLSDIRLTVHRDIILEFQTEILGETISMYGSVVWMHEAKPGIFQYGLEFLVEENERSNLAKLLNKFAILLRKNPIVPDCNFVKTDRYHFIKNQREILKTE